MAINFNTGVNITRTAGSNAVFTSGTYGLLRATNPSFAMYNGNAATVGTVVTYSNTEFDVTSSCNAGTGRFTAPVAGMYYFKYHQLVNYATAGEYRALFRVNAVGQPPRSILYKTTASTYTTIMTETIHSLAVNDYVDVYIETAPAAMGADTNWSFFQGYKI